MNSSSVKKIIISILACIMCVALLCAIYFMMHFQKIKNVPPQDPSEALQLNDQMTDAEKKDSLIIRANNTETKPLTDSEKSAIINELGGEKSKKYNLTTEEKAAILKSLNAK